MSIPNAMSAGGSRADRLEIRLGTARDAEAIALESMAEIEHNLHWQWTPARVEAAMREPDVNVVVACEAGRVVGFGIMQYTDEVAHLQLFAVLETHRRRRIGSMLLQWLEQVAREAGVNRVKVEARRDNEPALAFYRHHGYVGFETVRGMYADSVDGIRLEKWMVKGKARPPTGRTDVSEATAAAVAERYRSIGLFGGLFLGGFAGVAVAGPHFHDWAGSRSLMTVGGTLLLGGLIGYIAGEIAVARLASPPGLPGAAASTDADGSTADRDCGDAGDS